MNAAPKTRVGWHAPAVRAQEKGCLHFIDGMRLYASRGNCILSGLANEPLRPLGRLPLGAFGVAVAAVRPLSRLLRRQIAHVVPYRDHVVVFGFGRIWNLDARSGELTAPPTSILGSRPLVVCRTRHGLYYGEYRRNRERGPVHVYFSADGLRWDSVHRLDSVRHVHGIFHDPYTESLWMTTGDSDAESAIWRTDDRFATLSCVLSGTQQTRAIGLLFTRDHVYFGSDTPDERNHLYRIERSTGTCDRMLPVEGSVFHAANVEDWLVFSTAVEPSLVNRGGDAIVYGSPDGDHWHELARMRKDHWSGRYLQYGQLILPAGNNRTGRLWYSTLATEHDNHIHSGDLHAAP